VAETLVSEQRAHGAAHAHKFDDAEQQRDTVTMGMWVFLATEIMFFGGLFASYTIYRGMYPAAFAIASRSLDITLGTLNTAVLLLSSFTMVVAVFGSQMGRRRLLIGGYEDSVGWRTFSKEVINYAVSRMGINGR
jgi:cytochrome c oxidase subunit III